MATPNPSSEKGFERFQKAIVNALYHQCKPVLEKHKNDFEEAVKNELLNLDGPRQVSYKSSAKDLFIRKVADGFFEISQSIETLDDIAFYIGRFPFQGTRITQERYLQFQVEAHLSEIYLFQQRLDGYVTKLERSYKHDPNIKAKCNTLKESAYSSLKTIILTRGKHVHDSRFKDRDIERLSTIALFSKISDDELSDALKEYYREEYCEIRKTWRARVKSNNKAIHELINHIFSSLFPIVFDEKTNLLNFPPSIAK